MFEDIIEDSREHYLALQDDKDVMFRRTASWMLRCLADLRRAMRSGEVESWFFRCECQLTATIPECSPEQKLLFVMLSHLVNELRSVQQPEVLGY